MIKDVILCGECKHFNITEEKPGKLPKGFCWHFGGIVHGDGFCHRAEKRVNNETKKV